MAKEVTKPISLFHVAIILFFILFLNIGGMGDKFKGWISTEVEELQPQDGTVCLHDRATMTIGRFQDALYTNNVVNREYARVYINGQDRGLFVDGSNIVVTPAADYVEIYYSINSSSYYAALDNFTVPCSSAFSTSEFGDGNKIYKSSNEDSTNITDSWLCRDENWAKITSTNDYDFTASNPKTVTCEISAPDYEGFSPHGKPAVCFEYDNSHYDNMRVVGESQVPSPAYMNDIYVNANNNNTACFTIPDSIIGNEIKSFNILIEPDASYTAGNWSMWLIDMDWYKNTQTGEMTFDYQNNDGDDVGTAYEVKYLMYGG